MKILAIDTSNTICSVALLDGNSLIAKKNDTTPSKQAENLFPLIESIFNTTGYTYNMLDAIAVTIGPGSFTGIRIGLSAARGIGLASHLPVIGVTTLEATAWSAAHDSSYKKDTPILVALDARRQQVYVQLFLEPLNPLSEADLVEYNNPLPHLPKGHFFLAGSGGDLIAPTLQQHSEGFTQITETSPTDATSVAYVAALKYPSYDLSSIPSPFYIRKPDAKPQGSKLILK